MRYRPTSFWRLSAMSLKKTVTNIAHAPGGRTQTLATIFLKASAFDSSANSACPSQSALRFTPLSASMWRTPRARSSEGWDRPRQGSGDAVPMCFILPVDQRWGSTSRSYSLSQCRRMHTGQGPRPGSLRGALVLQPFPPSDVCSVAREEETMSTCARSAFNAALDGAALGLAAIAVGMLILWWWVLPF